MKLKPLQNGFIFEFTNDTAGGKFIERSKGGIILTNQNLDEQMKFARWGKVLAVGPKVDEFGVGEFVLIESGKWSSQTRFEDKNYWRSLASFVLAVSDDENDTYAY